MAIIHILPVLISLLSSPPAAETAYELYSIGNNLELAGNVNLAIEYYKKAIMIDMSAVEIYITLANVHYKIRHFDKGIEWATKALAVRPDEENIYLTIGTGYIGKGDFKTAVKFFQQALFYKPGDIEITTAIATLFEAAGETKEAVEVLEQIPSESKSNDIYNRLAEISGRANDHTTAVDYYRRAYALDSTNITSIIGLGTGFDLLGVKDSCIFYYEKAVLLDTLPNINKRLIDLYSDTEQFFKLISTAVSILQNDFYENAVRRSLAYALFKTGSVTGALNEFLLASRIEPDDTYSRFYVARIYLEKGMYSEAKDEIAQAIRINPDFIELWIYLGFIALDLRDYGLATQAFSEAAHRGGDLVQIRYLLGVVLEMQGKERDAYFSYKQALTLDPNSLSALEALANLCDRIGKKDEAFSHFKKIVNLDTTNAIAMNYVGYTFAEQAESLTYALGLIEKALVLEPNNGYYIDSKAWVYYQSEQYEEALKNLLTACELVQDAVVLEHLGDVYIKLNDIEKAKSAYQKALQSEPGSKTIKRKLDNLK